MFPGAHVPPVMTTPVYNNYNELQAMFTPKIFVLTAIAGTATVYTQNQPSVTWWIGMVIAVASAVLAYLQNNK